MKKDGKAVNTPNSQRPPLANAEVGACGNKSFRRNLLPQLHQIG